MARTARERPPRARHDLVAGRDLAAQAWARITVPYIAQRPVMRRSQDGGRTFPRASSKGYRYEVAIQPKLPSRPTTVPTCDPHLGHGRLLVLDLDTSRVPPEGAADRAGYITVVVEQVVGMIAECGGQALVDRSPSGGAHVYVLWEAARPHAELRMLARAFALRFAPVVDTSPMESSDGQIRGPGAPHKSEGGRLTGYMQLTCSVEDAEAICRRPCGPGVWERLQVELAAELDEVLCRGTVLEAAHPDAPDALLDVRGEPYRPQRGGRAPLREDLQQIARAGSLTGFSYPSRSEARMAVLTSAAARGWRLEQIRVQLNDEWAAIASWWRDDALLRTEWAKAVAYASSAAAPPAQAGLAKTPDEQKVGESVQGSNTRGIKITPPHPPLERSATILSAGTPARADQPGTAVTSTALPDNVRAECWRGLQVRAASWDLSEYQRIRVWQQAMRITERLMELEWGERAPSIRAVLRAIGAAAQMAGSTVIEFGCRQLAYMTGLDHTTISRVLQILRTGPLPLVDLVMEAQGTRADVYQLVVPDSIAAEAAWRTWRPGRIEAIHPAFRVLGLSAAFCYEALTTAPLSVQELATAALLPRSSAYEALRTLAAHGLAERDPTGGWRRGLAFLDAVAAEVGADELAAAHLLEHRADRKAWHTWLGITEAFAAPSRTDDHVDQAPQPGGAHVPAQRHAGAPPVPADRHRSGRRGRPSTRRGRAAAPPWLRPAPEQPITESALIPPVDALAVVDELRDLATESGWADHAGPPLPADVHAAIRDDLTVIISDDGCQAAEQEAYEAELAALRTLGLGNQLAVPGSTPAICAAAADRPESGTSDYG